jgi:hypothetical protein
VFPQSAVLAVLTAISLFGGLLAALELWFHLGVRARKRRAEHPDQLGNIQGATLGLLALLLGFSFALAAGRFSDRTQLILREANAISTAWNYCDLLASVPRAETRKVLKEYVEQRIAFYEAPDEGARAASVAVSETLHRRIWATFSVAANNSPQLAQVLLPTASEITDMHAARIAASQRHMPSMMLALLLACSLVSVASVGYGCGVAGKRNVVLTTALTFLIAGTLWAILDMDHPRKGLIRVGQQPMLDLRRTLQISEP